MNKTKFLTYKEISTMVLMVPEDSKGPLDDYILSKKDADVLDSINRLMEQSKTGTGIRVRIQWEIRFRRNLSEEGYGLN